MTPFNALVVQCWNFAGGFEPPKLLQAAVFYEVHDVDMLLRLAMVIRNETEKRIAAHD